MAEGEKNTKKTAAESFSEMVGEFGNALGEIFKDPKVQERAQAFAQSIGQAIQAFTDKLKEEEVKQRFRQAGRTAEQFGQKVTKHFGASKKDSSPRSDFEMGIDKAVQWARRMGTRRNDYLRSTRVQRLISYNLAIAWNFIFLIFFNFFHQYLAYYHYEIAEGVGQWMREPLLSAEFATVLPILNIALILSILGNGVLIVFDKYLLRQGVFIILHVFSLAVTSSFLTVFPFNFEVLPFPNASQVLSIIVPIVLIAIIIGLIVGIVVRIVRIVITSIRAKI